MSGLLVRDGRELPPDAFFELPWRVYAGDPYWIPEETDRVAEEFSRRNPWFNRGRAVTVTVPGRSRAAGFLPGLRVDGREAAFFGYWESVGDAAADGAVLREIEGWAADGGAATLFGPIDFSTYGRYRLRLSAEPGAIPFPGEPYNPPEYPDRLRALGYRLHRAYLSQVGPAPTARHEEKSPKLESLRAAGYRIEPLRPDTWLAALPELHGLVDGIFGENFAYTSLPYDQFARLCGLPLAGRMCPDTSAIAYGPAGDIAGFVLVFPHYGPLVVQGAGAGRVPASHLSHATHLPALRRHGDLCGIVKTAGVTPAHRRSGVLDALAVTVLDRGADRYAHWQAALIRADNHSRRFADGSPHERWYGLFARPLPTDGARS